MREENRGTQTVKNSSVALQQQQHGGREEEGGGMDMVLTPTTYPPQKTDALLLGSLRHFPSTCCLQHAPLPCACLQRLWPCLPMPLPPTACLPAYLPCPSCMHFTAWCVAGNISCPCPSPALTPLLGGLEKEHGMLLNSCPASQDWTCMPFTHGLYN